MLKHSSHIKDNLQISFKIYALMMQLTVKISKSKPTDIARAMVCRKVAPRVVGNKKQLKINNSWKK